MLGSRTKLLRVNVFTGCGCRTNAELSMELKRSEMEKLSAMHESTRLKDALEKQLSECKQIQVCL